MSVVYGCGGVAGLMTAYGIRVMCYHILSVIRDRDDTVPVVSHEQRSFKMHTTSAVQHLVKAVSTARFGGTFSTDCRPLEYMS